MTPGHKFNPLEVLSAGADVVAVGIGTRVSLPHPLAGALSLRDLAYAAGVIVRKQQEFETELSVVGRGMGTSDFSRVIADGVRSVTIATYSTQAEHLAYTVPVDVNNYQPVAIPSMEGDVDLEPLEGEGFELSHFHAMLAGGTKKAALATFGRMVNISREAILNNQVADFGRLFSGFGASGARLESRLVAAALEANPELDDGRVAFDAEHSNVLAQPLDANSLGSAMALLRTQPTASGQRADLRARHLVVEPALERVAREIVQTSGLELVISVLAALPEGRWYLLADPVASPAIGILRLFGAKHPVRVEGTRRPIHMDGACVKIAADVGACVLRRIGVVRGG